MDLYNFRYATANYFDKPDDYRNFQIYVGGGVMWVAEEEILFHIPVNSWLNF